MHTAIYSILYFGFNYITFSQKNVTIITYYAIQTEYN